MNKESNSIFEQIIKEINICLEHECFMSALGMALTLPDICGKAEYPTDGVTKGISNGQMNILALMKG